MEEKYYLCIDLKSFYASVECVERGLDPMTTDLVVADPSRTDKTICLAVSPSLKAQGVSGRARVFEIPKHLQEKMIMAPPRMQLYIDYAANIYGVYLDYIAPEDMHVYSVDEVFFDITKYMRMYKMTAKELAVFLMEEVYERIGVRATAGIGTNLYLAKIALDITAKHASDFIGELDEKTYKEKLWDHKPLKDFWMIGKNTENKLAKIGIETMRDIANADEDLLYRMFGINAELMIDHANGIEPVSIADIKGYKAKSHSLSHGQVLMRDYSHEEGLLIVKEMVEGLCQEVTALHKVTKNVSIMVGYSNVLKLPLTRGSVSFNTATSSSTLIMKNVSKLYDEITNHEFPVRRIFVNFNNLEDEDANKQISIFDMDEGRDEEKDRALQRAVNKIKFKYGADAMFRGMDLEEAATSRERNHQIGGHKA